MKVAILAAGFSSRMKGYPKHLLKIDGYSIIEYTIKRLLDFQAQIYVVYNRHELYNFLKFRYPDIEFIYNDRPDLENGYSTLLAMDYIKTSCFIIMGDHLFSSDFFYALPNIKSTSVVVSKFCHDPDEATKVYVENNYVINIDKTLKKYNYFDTGLFFFEKKDVEEILKDFSPSIKQPVRHNDIAKFLSQRKRLLGFVVDGIWFDIDNYRDFCVAKDYSRRMFKSDASDRKNTY